MMICTFIVRIALKVFSNNKAYFINARLSVIFAVIISYKCVSRQS